MKTVIQQILCPLCQIFLQAIEEESITASTLRFALRALKELGNKKKQNLERELSQLSREIDLVGSPRITEHVFAKLFSRLEEIDLDGLNVKGECYELLAAA